MDKTARNKILGRIKDLYKSHRKIEYFNREITRLMEWLQNNRREQVELKGLNINPFPGSIDYSKERVTSSPKEYSQLDRELERYVEKLQLEELRLIKEIRNKDRRVRTIQKEFGSLEYNLELLSPQCKQLIELLCKENKDFNYVAYEMFGGSRTSAYSKLDNTLQSIVDFEGWNI